MGVSFLLHILAVFSTGILFVNDTKSRIHVKHFILIIFEWWCLVSCILFSFIQQFWNSICWPSLKIMIKKLVFEFLETKLLGHTSNWFHCNFCFPRFYHWELEREIHLLKVLWLYTRTFRCQRCYIFPLDKHIIFISPDIEWQNLT